LSRSGYDASRKASFVSTPETNPYAPPLAAIARTTEEPVDCAPLWRGHVLVAGKGATLAEVCAKCGREDTLQWRTLNFEYVPRLISFLPTLLTLALRRTASVHFAICDRCAGRWRRANIVALFVIAGSTCAGLLGLYALLLWLQGKLAAGAVAAIALVACGIAAPPLYDRFVFAVRDLRAQAIDETRVWLLGVHPDAAARTCFPGPGVDVPARARVRRDDGKPEGSA
jgi:hypothetical protein